MPGVYVAGTVGGIPDELEVGWERKTGMEDHSKVCQTNKSDG